MAKDHREIRYSRYLNCGNSKRLLPDGDLRCLVDCGFAATEASDSESPNRYDCQLREKQCLQIYLGDTSLLKLRFLQRNARISVASAYIDNKGVPDNVVKKLRTALMKGDCDPKTLSDALEAFLRKAARCVHANKRRITTEGYWEQEMSLSWGYLWNPQSRWLVIDRQAVIGHSDKVLRNRIWKSIQKKYHPLMKTLHAREHWAKPHNLGNELDLLAIDQDGYLACIELKRGANSSGIYYGPFQAAAYWEAFREHLPVLREGIGKLLRQKAEIGLLPSGALERAENIRGVKAVLAVAETPRPASAVSKKRMWASLDFIREWEPAFEPDIVSIRRNQDGVLLADNLPRE